jgi:uncharacterized membrane protein
LPEVQISTSEIGNIASPTPPIDNVPNVPKAPSEPSAGSRLSDWLKEDWLLKLGALMLILGFSWLVTYAFMNNWIGPVGRIVFGVVAGTCLLAFGYYRMRKYIHQGGVFLVLGSSVVILTLFAARTYYDFLTPFSALAIMFLASAFVALASVRYRVRSLAMASLLLAAVTPLLVNSGSHNYFALFIYLFVITVGTVWVVALTGWRTLLVASLLMVTFYSIPQWLFGAEEGVMMMIYAFSALFFAVGTLGIIKAQIKDASSDLLVACGNGIVLLVWIINAVPEEWQSLIIATWMMVFAIGGFIVFRITKHPAPFLLYAGVATAMLAAATAVELQGASLTIAFIFEALAIPLIIYALLRDLRMTERAGLLLVVPAVMSIPSFVASEWWSGLVFHENFFVLLVMAVALIILGVFIWRRRSESPTPLTIYPLFIVGGLVYAYILLWLSLHSAIEIEYVATIVSLVIYTLIGIVTYFYGKSKEVRLIRLHGGVLIGFVVGRLLLVDVWDMEMGWRIVMFFLVGVLLVATAFVGRKKKTISAPLQ